MKSVLNFSADGSAVCVHTDAIPLESIGTLTIRRASTVDFNEATQLWEVRWADSPEVVAFSNASRSVCLEWEVATLNERLLAD